MLAGACLLPAPTLLFVGDNIVKWRWEVRVSGAGLVGGAFAISMAAACASGPHYETAAGTVDLSAYPSVTLDASELQVLRGMSDANILGHLQTVDSLEVAAADSALRFSRNDATLNYAKLMHHAHTDDLKRE